MASTRNRNTLGDYSLETRENVHFTDKMLYKHSAYGFQENTYLPGDGVFSAKLPYTELAYNAVDIETYLRGTRATDLVNPGAAANFKPELKELKSLCMYRKPKVVMPLPLVSEKHQRPSI